MAVPTVCGFIGLGVMGGPMCTHLATSTAAPIIAYDSDAATLDAHTGPAVRAATDIAGLAAACDVVFLSLFDLHE